MIHVAPLPLGEGGEGEEAPVKLSLIAPLEELISSPLAFPQAKKGLFPS
jgi:hypothetical protein